VSRDAVSLREVDVILNHTTKTKATVDDGCLIVMIREDLWRNMEGPPLHLDTIMSMEGADKSINRTLGKLKDLPLQIGNITFYVQAQVVTRSPVPLLLGMPFFALSNCTKEFHDEGDMTLTITNPN
ncbi:hypothetical protein SISNIDRAFT_394110, partial [Sistotremastrum niveocremeum HHB9708]